MKFRRSVSIMMALLLIVCSCFVSLFGIDRTYAADLKGDITLNSQFTVNVEGGGDYLYSLNIIETGVLAISGDFDSHSGGWIKILDNNGKIVATDEGKWGKNNITGKDNLSLVYQCTPGKYYIEILNNSDKDIYPVNMYIKYTKINSFNNSGTIRGNLNRDEMLMYKVELPYTSYLNFKGDFYESISLTVYVLDENGVELDHDRTAEDWKHDNTTNLNRMNFNSMTLKKGTYYIKVVNQMSGNLSYDIKYLVKVPATNIKLNKTKLTLKKGERFKLKAKVTPSKTTDTLKWTSSNKNIVTVSKAGTVNAKKKGVAYIMVTSTSGKQKKVKVTVK
ncbi:Ig-like domain-containing protein [Catonella morbi]|nr:Ig-like domain-containing protein [Catonella morbi]